MTYHDYEHPIITNPYKSAKKGYILLKNSGYDSVNKNEHINLKLSGYDHSGHLRSFRKPKLILSNLTSPSLDLT